jgi:hypothetical protein
MQNMCASLKGFLVAAGACHWFTWEESSSVFSSWCVIRDGVYYAAQAAWFPFCQFMKEIS